MTQMMSVEEVEELIIERLPQVLENDPRFATWLEGFLAQRFPRRDEFAQLINEVQQHRAESAQQFIQVDQHLGKVEEEVQQHRVETAQQFTQVDQRLGKVEEEVRQHRVETAQQFTQVDQHLGKVEEEVRQHRVETVQQFAGVNQRFEQVDQRFEQVDQRFEQLEQKMGEGFRQVQITIDRLGSRWGIRNESIFRQTMQAVLEDSFGTKVQERYIGGEQFDCVIIGDNHILIEISASVGRDIVRKLQRKRQLYTDETGISPARFILAVGSIHSQRANALREAGFEVIEPEVEEV